MAASLNRILELVQDRPREGRDLLFRHICDLFFNGPLPSPEDCRNLQEVLELLRPRVDITVRRELAGRLYSMEQPPEILLRLALGDLDEVAGPVIDYAALPEALILEIAQSGPVSLRRRLARRRDLSDRARMALDQSLAAERSSGAGDPAASEMDIRAALRDLEETISRIRQDNRKLQDYSRTASDWLWECDRKGRLTYLSETALTAFGRPPSALLGHYLDDLCSDGDETSSGELRARLDGWRAFGDLPVVISAAANAASTPWLLRAVPVFNLDNGRFEGFRGSARPQDATIPAMAPKPAEPAAQSPDDQVIDELLGELGHELKTPLNAILGFSEMMELGTFGPIGPEYGRCLTEMRQAGQQVDDIISDILDNAKSRPRGTEPVCEEIAAADLVAAAIERVRSATERRQLVIDAAPLPFQIRLTTDPAIAEYCLVRLLRCAIAESPVGARLSVRMARSSDGSLAIHVPATDSAGDEPSPTDGQSVAARQMIKNHRIAEADEMARRIGGRAQQGPASLILTLPATAA